MYIHKIHIHKFKHLENITIHITDFTQLYTEAIILAGPNGGGKSSILELIAFGISSSANWTDAIRRSFPDPSFEIAIGLSEREIGICIRYVDSMIEKQNDLIEQRKVEFKTADHFRQQEIGGEMPYLEMELNSMKKHRLYFIYNNIYYRAVNYTQGEYVKNHEQYDHIFNTANSALAENLPVGFFLKSDRQYPKYEYKPEDIRDYAITKHRNHLVNMSFTASETQYTDLYTFLLQERAFQRQAGPLTAGAKDPLSDYEGILNKILPGYKFYDSGEDSPKELKIEIPSGEIILFSDLSSGEREVFFILSFFARYNVEDSIILLDEPELHLHPELARILMSEMKRVGARNQLWIATHSSEIIDDGEANRTYFLSIDPYNRKSQIVSSGNEAEIQRQLKTLFGFSGYVGIRNLVFLEGVKKSVDRRLFMTLDESSRIKFIPMGGSKDLSGIHAAMLAMLENQVGYMNFYLIRDRDYLTEELITKFYGKDKIHRTYVLEKHEIENYLLIPELIRSVIAKTFGKQIEEQKIERTIHQCALTMATAVLRKMMEFRVPEIMGLKDHQPDDRYDNLSLFNYLDKTPNVQNVDVLRTHLITSENHPSRRGDFIALFGFCLNEITESIQGDDWKKLFPGKELLQNTAKSLGITKTGVFVETLIKELGSRRDLIPHELIGILNTVNKSGSFR
jgi:energy-coupling factor transporter ATP-binding protein EcfA2